MVAGVFALVIEVAGMKMIIVWAEVAAVGVPIAVV
jgi:hypothetical protein